MIRLSLAALALSLAPLSCGGGKIRPVDLSYRIEATPEIVKRGEYIVNGPGACGVCHNSHADGNHMSTESTVGYMNGGDVMDMGEVGIKLWISNITPDAETGIGAWSDDEVMRAIRDGVRPDGRVLFPMMPYTAYQNMSDNDARAVVAYLRSLPPQKPASPRFDPVMPGMYKFMFQTMKVTLHEPAVGVGDPDPNDKIARGKYLMYLDHCSECHAAGKMGPVPEGDPMWMAGAQASMVPPQMKESWGEIWATNLTPDLETGIGKYSEADIQNILLTGRRPDGGIAGFPMFEFRPFFANWTVEDRDALTAFLKSLPPVKHEVPKSALGPAMQAYYDAKVKELEADEAAAKAKAEADAKEKAEAEAKAKAEAETKAKAAKVREVTRAHIDGLMTAGKGTYTITDEASKKPVKLEFVAAAGAVEDVPGKGLVTCATFHVQKGAAGQDYDLDFWVGEKDGAWAVTGATVHKAPRKEGAAFVADEKAPHTGALVLEAASN